jgi:hypothetical protein
MQVFIALWHSDWRNLYDINDAMITLIRKSEEASSLKDYCMISLIHLIGKLVSKVLANCLVPRLLELVRYSQSAFIKGQSIHDNF